MLMIIMREYCWWWWWWWWGHWWYWRLCKLPLSSDKSIILLSWDVWPSVVTLLGAIVTAVESSRSSQPSSRTNRWLTSKPSVPPSSKAADVLWNNGSTWNIQDHSELTYCYKGHDLRSHFFNCNSTFSYFCNLPFWFLSIKFTRDYIHANQAIRKFWISWTSVYSSILNLRLCSMISWTPVISILFSGPQEVWDNKTSQYLLQTPDQTDWRPGSLDWSQ